MTKATNEVNLIRAEMCKGDNEGNKSESANKKVADKKLSEMSDEELKELGYKRYKDGSIRDSLGHFAGNSGIRPGSPAVDIVEKYLKSKNYIINGREISVKSPQNGRRMYDIVVTNKEDGTVIGIEVKSGSASRNKHQREIDAELVKSRGLKAVGKKAKRAGIKEVSDVMLIHVDYDGNIKIK